jgi:peptidoglycan/LPS O-acetylase OafA/YrhL
MKTWGYSAIDFGFVFLLAWVLVEPRGIAAAICRSRVLQSWGGVSYCVYIIHQAVALFFAALFSSGTLNLPPWSAATVAILATAATFGIARLSWIYFERPVLQIGHSFKY